MSMIKAALQLKPNCFQFKPSTDRSVKYLSFASQNGWYLQSISVNNDGNLIRGELLQMTTLKDQIGQISCIKWISSNIICIGDVDGQFQFIHVTDDLMGTIIYKDKVNSHLSMISLLDVCSCVIGAQIIVFLSFSDGQIMVFCIEDNNVSHCSTFSIQKGHYSLCLECVALEVVDQNGLNDFCILLFNGSTDSSVMIYSQVYSKIKTQAFEYKTSLRGHTDWIKDVSLVKVSNDKLILASASQDKFIRLYNIKLTFNQSEQKSLLYQKLEQQFSTKLHYIKLDGFKQSVEINLDAVLCGHDDWVHSLEWSKNFDGVLQLISASADKSIVIWELENNSYEQEIDQDAVSQSHDDKVWVASQRLYDLATAINGNVGSQSGGVGCSTAASSSVGGNGGVGSCGFFMASKILFGDKQIVAGHAYAGSLQFWQLNRNSYQVLPSQSGHFSKVKGIEWSVDGKLLLTTSLDKTCRLWTQMNIDGKSQWMEICRPQIHGYPLLKAVFLSDDGLQYASVSEGEKIIRVFQASQLCKKLIQSSQLPVDVNSYHEEFWSVSEASTLPALGLSNKASQVDQTLINNLELNHGIQPFENHLSSVTLWEEVDKLYSHGDDLFSIAVSHDFSTLVSANLCRASLNDVETKEGSMRIWRINQNGKDVKFVKISSSNSHNQTITSIRFSLDDKYILTVSRDRQWTIFQKDNQTQFYFESQRMLGAHSRMIWDCCWLKDSQSFVTVARDKTIKIWALNSDGKFECVNVMKKTEVPISVDCNHHDTEKNTIAIGYENGHIAILKSCNYKNWESTELESGLCPLDKISQIRWRPHSLNELAIASEDSSIRIIKLD